MPCAATDRHPLVAGVDGCPGGWVVVLFDGVDVLAERHERLDELVGRYRSGGVGAVAIDMPIGLLDDRPRASDALARRVIGPRRSSVFPTPVRATLDATDYTDACERSRAASGRALSKQAFHLLPKIRALDALLVPEDRSGIVEAHPECAFARLAAGPLAHPKHRAEGRTLRRRLLVERFGPSIESILDGRVAPAIDLLDAAVLVATALHVVAGTEIRLGNEVDSTGMPAEIVY